MRNWVLVVAVIAMLSGLGIGGQPWATTGGNHAEAAPSAPWLFDLWKSEPISTTLQTRTFTLERGEAAHVLYDLGETSNVTTTTVMTMTVAEGWNGGMFYTQTVTGSVNTSTAATGVVTLTALYPNVAVSVQAAAAGVVTSTIGVWQR
jgi:hypothetical protein